MSAKPLVVILTDDFPPNAGGGIGVWAGRLAEQLHDKGYPIHILARRRKDYGDAFPVTRMNGRNWNHTRGVNTFRYLAPLLLHNRNAIVIASTWQFCTWLTPLQRLAPFRLIVCAHGTETTKGVAIASRLRSMRRVLRSADVVAPVSHYLANIIREHAPEANARLEVVHNGIDAAHFNPVERNTAREKLGWERRSPVLLTVGRMIPVKGHMLLLQALPQIVEQHPDLQWRVVGKAIEPVRSQMQAFIEQHDLTDHVFFTPHMSPDELTLAYAAAEIFAHPSHRITKPFCQEDNLPLTVLEAMACEACVLGGDYGGLPEMIEHRVNGVLVDPQNIDAMAREILALLANPDVRATYGAAARKTVRNQFTMQHMGDRFARLIEETNE